MTDPDLKYLVKTGSYTQKDLAAITGLPLHKLRMILPEYNFAQYRQWYFETMNRRVLKCARRFMTDEQIHARYGYSIHQIRMRRYRYVKRGKYVQGQNPEKAFRVAQCLKRYPDMALSDIAIAANCSRCTARRYKKLLAA